MWCQVNLSICVGFIRIHLPSYELARKDVRWAPKTTPIRCCWSLRERGSDKYTKINLTPHAKNQRKIRRDSGGRNIYLQVLDEIYKSTPLKRGDFKAIRSNKDYYKASWRKNAWRERRSRIETKFDWDRAERLIWSKYSSSFSKLSKKVSSSPATILTPRRSFWRSRNAYTPPWDALWVTKTVSPFLFLTGQNLFLSKYRRNICYTHSTHVGYITILYDLSPSSNPALHTCAGDITGSDRSIPYLQFDLAII